MVWDVVASAHRGGRAQRCSGDVSSVARSPSPEVVDLPLSRSWSTLIPLAALFTHRRLCIAQIYRPIFESLVEKPHQAKSQVVLLPTMAPVQPGMKFPVAILFVNSLLVALSAACVCLRLWARRLRKVSLQTNDYLMCCSWVSTIECHLSETGSDHTRSSSISALPCVAI